MKYVMRSTKNIKKVTRNFALFSLKARTTMWYQ